MKYIPAFTIEVAEEATTRRYNGLIDGEDFGHYGASPDEALGCALRSLIDGDDKPIHLTVKLCKHASDYSETTKDAIAYANAEMVKRAKANR